jgi:hypothetical protein
MCRSHAKNAQGHGPLPGPFVYSGFHADLELTPARSLDEIEAMTPDDMARASRIVSGAYNELLQTASSLEDPEYRRLMTECVAAPKVTFLEQYPTRADKQRIFDDMVQRGFFNAEDDVDHVFPPGHMNPQSYLTAPSSHNAFYNAHPGGLALTVAYNIRMADAYTYHYRQTYGLPINRDLPAAALCVHEYPKVWLYQWLEDGSWLEEPRTVYDDTWHAHCIYVTAEMMYRRFDARLTMAMAAAHQLGLLDASMRGRDVVTNWIGESRVAHFLEAAAALAQVDPVEYGVLERKNGRLQTGPLPAEQWVTHLADMNWPYTMGAAHNYTWPLLQQLARDVYGIGDGQTRRLNQFKNYVWSQLGQIALYEILVREGFDAAKATVRRLVQARHVS